MLIPTNVLGWGHQTRNIGLALPFFTINMTEYSKLKVIELKDELGRRGLGKSGLKADLVRRLVEADAQSEEVNDEGSQTLGSEAPPVDAETVPSAALLEQEPSTVNGADHADVQSNEEITSPSIVPFEDVGHVSASEQSKSGGLETSVDELGEVAQRIQEEARSAESNGRTNGSPLAQPLHLSTLSSSPTQAKSSSGHLAPISTQGSLTAEELLEDSKKRKRRSQSPPPSSATVSKKFKAEDVIPENFIEGDKQPFDRHPDSQDIPTIGNSDDAPIEDVRQLPTEDRIDVEAAPNLPDAKLAAEIPHDHDPLDGMAAPSTMGDDPQGHAVFGTDPKQSETRAQSPPSKMSDSSVKASPSDARFKNLFSGPAAPSTTLHTSSTSQEPLPTVPSIHPATSALYIRELMRPLNPKIVQEHLAALAAPPNASVDNSVLTECFLDKNRTHCLVGFSSIGTASRVRASLHDRVWPNERDRKALWVDFIPEEKLQKWIQVESEISDRRGQPQKRWEVVYENEDGDVRAYLQEVSGKDGGLRATTQVAAIAGDTGLRAPSGPRADSSSLRDDHGKGFQALDDLFRFTDAKPRLYYAPRTKEVVDERLATLGAGRGGGRSDELRRFSFEDNVIVDRGPEYGFRGRGGYRGGRGNGFEGSTRGRNPRGEMRSRGGPRFGGDTYRVSARY